MSDRYEKSPEKIDWWSSFNMNCDDRSVVILSIMESIDQKSIVVHYHSISIEQLWIMDTIYFHNINVHSFSIEIYTLQLTSSIWRSWWSQRQLKLTKICRICALFFFMVYICLRYDNWISPINGYHVLNNYPPVN